MEFEWSETPQTPTPAAQNRKATDEYFRKQTECVDLISYMLNEAIQYLSKSTNFTVPASQQSITQIVLFIETTWDSRFASIMDASIRENIPKLKRFCVDWDRYANLGLGTVTRGQFKEFMETMNVLLEFLNQVGLGEFLNRGRQHLHTVLVQL